MNYKVGDLVECIKSIDQFHKGEVYKIEYVYDFGNDYGIVIDNVYFETGERAKQHGYIFSEYFKKVEEE